MSDTPFHSGFVAIVGRPNVGKSTLMNRILGQKISIRSRKPQTTRHRILGIKTDEQSQAIYVDTPGLHLNAKKAMNRFINKAVTSTFEDVNLMEIAKELKDVQDIYILGRAVHYPIALESALKLKELSYIHAEGIPGGELKHGPLALMDSSVYVIIMNPNDFTYNDTLTSAPEIKARGAKIIGISDKSSDVYDHWIQIPTIDDALYPLN